VLEKGTKHTSRVMKQPELPRHVKPTLDTGKLAEAQQQQLLPSSVTDSKKSNSSVQSSSTGGTGLFPVKMAVSTSSTSTPAVSAHNTLEEKKAGHIHPSVPKTEVIMSDSNSVSCWT
jgi:hypothetical protein